MRLTISLLVFTLLFSCNSTTETTDFPDVINVTKTADMKRVKGTKLFVKAPDSYKPVENMIRLQRDNHTYIQILSIPDISFSEYCKKMDRKTIESQGAKVDIYKTVQYNGYNAIYVSGPSKVDGETKLMFAFGDETFVILGVGVYKTADLQALKEINSIFSTSYFDKSFPLDPLELANYTFDQSITGFKCAKAMGNAFIYTPNGPADIGPEKNASTFQLYTIEASSYENAKSFVEHTISQFDQGDNVLSNLHTQEILVDGNRAYEATMNLYNKEFGPAVSYQLVIHNGNTAVIFMGIDVDNGKWMEQFKATAQSIRMK